MQANEPGLTEEAGEAEAPPGQPGRQGKLAAGIARGALLIAVLTAVSRILGLTRTLVFSQSVGAGCLGTAYVTANQVPNLIYELAIGGALTSAMVPVLARSAARANEDEEARQHVARTTSALLTWAVIILLPLTGIVAALANPIASLLIPANPNAACARPEVVAATGTMLAVFAPQVVLYGLSVVLFGLLQAYRRFTGPTLAPVLANVVVITSYLLFARLDQNHGAHSLASTPLAAELVLAVGTTMNIGTLVLVAIPPVARLRLRLRPTVRFPPNVLRQAGGLALVGVLEFIAADIYSVVQIALANGRGDTGALVLVNYAYMVFTSVASVLPIAIVISAFPVLSATDGPEFDRTVAGSTRAVLLTSWLGTALIVAVSVPAAHILASQPDQVPQLVEAFILYAPGVAGLAVITNSSRVMFALGRLKVAAFGLVVSPLLTAAVTVPLVDLVPARMVVGAISLGATVVQLAVAVPMIIAIRWIRGPAALRGVRHAAASSLVAGTIGAGVGLAATFAVPLGGKLQDAASGAVAAFVALLAYAVAALLLDRGDLRAMASRLPVFARFRPREPGERG